MDILLDRYPEDNGYDWVQVSPNPQTIATIPTNAIAGKGNDYQITFTDQVSLDSNNGPVSQVVCDGIYSFTFYDTWGDGLCCSSSTNYLDGYLKYTLDGVVIKEWTTDDSYRFTTDVFPFAVGAELISRQGFESENPEDWLPWKESTTSSNLDDSERVTYTSQGLPWNKASGKSEWCIRLRDNPSTGSSIFTGKIDVAGYNRLVLEFDYYADGFEDVANEEPEGFVVQYKIPNDPNGFKDEEFLQYKSDGSGIALREWKRVLVEFDTWARADGDNKPPEIDLRIMSRADEDNDQVFIDNIAFIGLV